MDLGMAAILMLLALCVYSLWKIEQAITAKTPAEPGTAIAVAESYTEVLQAQTTLLKKILEQLEEQTKALSEIQANTSVSGVLNDQLYHVGEKIVNVGARVTELERPLVAVCSQIVNVVDKLSER